MRAARGRGFWMVFLVVTVLSLPRYAAGYSVSKDSDEAPHDRLLTKDDGIRDGNPDERATALNITTDESITPNTTDDSSRSSTDDNSRSSTDDSNRSSTDDSSRSSTDDSSRSSTDGTNSPPTKNPMTSTTTPPPINDVKLYEDTRDELDKIESTLNQFLDLVQPAALLSAAGGSGDNPAGWWKMGKEEVETMEAITPFCSVPSYVLCFTLQSRLEETQVLVLSLSSDVDDWDEGDLLELQAYRKDISALYNEADGEKDKFTSSINIEAFKSAVNTVNEEVQNSRDKVDNKIKDLTGDGNTASIVLVAVIGSFGGLMIVGLVGVMIYGLTKKRKLKKKPSSTPYNKLQGENIPIDGFLADSRPAPRMDPYARNPGPSSRSDPYGASYGGRGDREYSRGPTVTRVGQGLPRTHF